MNATKIETTVQKDGELLLTHLPCKKGDRVEAIISILDKPVEEHTEEKKREEARRHFLELARTSTFRSTGPYPTRDELHERR